MAECFCLVGLWVNMQVGWPVVRAEGYLKFRMELGVRTRVGLTEGWGQEPGGRGFSPPARFHYKTWGKPHLLHLNLAGWILMNV